jgi:hypothetical protein
MQLGQRDILFLRHIHNNEDEEYMQACARIFDKGT